MKNRHTYYTFEYNNGKRVISGGCDGLGIVGDVNHDNTHVGDKVVIDQFNLSGSIPTEATIIGKISYDWDNSKDMGERKSNFIEEGVGYLTYLANK